jgi:hypothetical protein
MSTPTSRSYAVVRSDGVVITDTTTLLNARALAKQLNTNYPDRSYTVARSVTHYEPLDDSDLPAETLPSRLWATGGPTPMVTTSESEARQALDDGATVWVTDNLVDWWEWNGCDR